MLFRLFLQSLLLLLIVTFTEKGIFALYHTELSSNLHWLKLLSTLLWGIRFDLAISAALALLVTLTAWLGYRLLRRPLNPTLRWGTFLAGMLLIGIHGADLLYYGEASRHLGYELKEWYNSGSSLALAALQTYTIPVLLQLSLFIPLFYLNRWLFGLGNTVHLRRGFPGTLLTEAQLVAVLLLAVMMVRGGMQAIPLEPLHAQEIGDSKRATLALNGAYNAIHASLASHDIRPLLTGKPDPQEMKLVRQIYASQEAASSPLASSGKRPNIVIVFLESWSASYMQSYGYRDGTTPFFDQLRKYSLTTRGMLAGGHRTTEGMFATLCSWQNPLGQTVAQSHLQNYQYACLPELLGERGYHSAFFQGTNKNTSGTGAFAQLLGFNQSYGKEDVASHRFPLNSWGLHDPDLYEFTLDKMAHMPQPFVIGINTNSTHASELPPGVALPFAGSDPLANYLNLLHFADAALGDFVRSVENNPTFGNTLFVLVADHTGHVPGMPIQKYEIPFLIYAPGIIKPAQHDIVASQRDIAPTLHALLQLPQPAQFSGISLLADRPRSYADYYHQGLLGWVEGKQGVEITLTQRGEMRCFAFEGEGLDQRDTTCNAQHEERRQRALAFTMLSQSLLFEGKLAQFTGMR